MKYNFKCAVPFSEAEVASLNTTVQGLQVSGGYAVAVQVSTNTELPDPLIAELQKSVSDALSKKLGNEVEVSLVSSEY